MQFENRPPAEGINAQPEHLGREALWLIVGAIACLILLVVLADVGARWLAPRVPFSVEQMLAERMEGTAKALPAAELAANAALQGLSDRLRVPLGMPADITVQVRVSASDELNAYATVGGRIVVHRGLLRRLRGEHELAALLAHEMSHVQHRHVAASLGRGLAIGLVLSVVSADAGGRAADILLEQTGGIMLRGYGREHEREADAGALHASAALHGHVGGVVGLFQRIAASRSEVGDEDPEGHRQDCSPQAERTNEPHPQAANAEVPTWLSTHPADQDRIEAARRWADQHGVSLTGPAPSMPEAVVAWLDATRPRCPPTRAGP